MDSPALSIDAAFLQAGGTPEQLAGLIAGSTECAQKSGGTNDAFLQAIYHDALGRTVDELGRSVWSQALANGLSREQIVTAIFTSDEYRGNLVDSYYHQFLDRAAEPASAASMIATTTHEQGTVVVAVAHHAVGVRRRVEGGLSAEEIAMKLA